MPEGGLAKKNIKLIVYYYYVLFLLLLSNSATLGYYQFVYASGGNFNGELGLGDATARNTLSLIKSGGLSTISIKAIAAARSCSLMLSASGRLYTAGLNSNGQLGLGDGVTRYTPTLVLNGALSSISIAAISAGGHHSLVLAGGFVYGSGYNYDGQLGLSDNTDRKTPTLMEIGDISSISIKAISAGWHSLLLASTGFVYSTGWNAVGELGLGDIVSRYTPTLLKSNDLSSVSITAVSASAWYHSMMLSSTGLVYSTGGNTDGQLGLGDTIDRYTPTLIQSVSSISIVAISAGGYLAAFSGTYNGHTLLLAAGGRVYGVGYNGNGILGLSDAAARYTPTLMPTISSVTAVVAGAACSVCTPSGYPSSLLATSNNMAYTLGWNGFGGLGVGDTTSRSTPTLVSTSILGNVSSISGGHHYSLFLISGVFDECTSNTHNCNTNANCTDTAASFTCSCNVGYSGNGVSTCNDINECALNTNNCNTNAACSNTISSFTCACNTGYSGNGTFCDFNECFSNTHNCDANAGCVNTIGSFSCSCNRGYAGSGLTCVKISPSLVFSVGFNNYGQLGLGDTTDRYTPTLVTVGGISTITINAISSGYLHAIFLSNRGAVYSSGSNAYGQLGLGDAAARFTPTLVSLPFSVSIVAVSSGAAHSFLLSNEAKVYTNGFNDNGRLGLGDAADRYTPTLISSSLSFLTFSAGRWGSSALISTGGAAYAMGTMQISNVYTPTLVASPQSISFSSLSTGFAHTLLTTNQSLAYSAGYNANGELGLGDTTTRPTPTLVFLLSMIPIAAVAAGDFCSLLLSTQGLLYATGYNGNMGQLGLGIGDNADRYTPTLLSMVSSISFVSVSLGFSCLNGCSGTDRLHSLMVSSNGYAFGSGYNGNGSLGLADTWTRYTPTIMRSLSTVSIMSASAGKSYSLILGDLNECVANVHNCNINAACTNTIGSFTCTCNIGYSGSGSSCADINECTSNTHNCNMNAACTNTISSFTCSCNTGYSGNGTSCADINECTSNTHNCDPHATCTNTVSSFTCSCNTGYSGNGVSSCADINECALLNNCAAQNSACNNTIGSYTCQCLQGYSGSGIICVEIDECLLGFNNCHPRATCLNTVSSFMCSCSPGFSGSGVFCTDLDECNLGTHSCDNNATCTNTQGSFTCTCNLGYAPVAASCLDINECTLSTTNNCDKQHGRCNNTVGSFECSCNAGYFRYGLYCDVDECAQNIHNCNTRASCTDNLGSFECRCNAGSTGNGVSCSGALCDLPEATNCDQHATCTPSSPSSFTCSCNAGFSGNGISCSEIPWVVRASLFPIAPGVNLGASISGGADLNQDGIGDLVMGAPDEGNGVGSTYVFTASESAPSASAVIGGGYTRITISTLVLPVAKSIGISVSFGGDFDGDGVADVLVGTGGGYALLALMNRNGMIKSSHPLLSPGDSANSTQSSPQLKVTPSSFGKSVSVIADADGDGVVEAIIGEPALGRMWIYFLQQGGVGIKSYLKISTVLRSETVDNNTSITCSGQDIDGDGTDDTAVGYPLQNKIVILLLDAKQGKSKQFATIGNGIGGLTLKSGDAFGSSVQLCRDLNGDQVPDMLVGSPGDDDGGQDRGAIYLIFLSRSANVISFAKVSSTQGGLSAAIPALGDKIRFGTALAHVAGGNQTAIAVSTSTGSIWMLYLQGLVATPATPAIGIPITTPPATDEAILPSTQVGEVVQSMNNAIGLAAQFASTPGLLKQAQFTSLLNGDSNVNDKGNFIMGDVPQLSPFMSAPGCRLFSRMFVLGVLGCSVCVLRILLGKAVRHLSSRSNREYTGTAFVFPKWELVFGRTVLFGLLDAAGSTSAGSCSSPGQSITVGIAVSAVIFLLLLLYCFWLLHRIKLRQAAIWQEFPIGHNEGKTRMSFVSQALLWLRTKRLVGEWVEAAPGDRKTFAGYIEPVIEDKSQKAIAVTVVVDVVIRNLITWFVSYFGTIYAVWFLGGMAVLDLLICSLIRPFRDKVCNIGETIAALCRLISTVSVFLFKFSVLSSTVAISVLNAANIAGMVALLPGVLIQIAPVAINVTKGLISERKNIKIKYNLPKPLITPTVQRPSGLEISALPQFRPISITTVTPMRPLPTRHAQNIQHWLDLSKNQIGTKV